MEEKRDFIAIALQPWDFNVATTLKYAAYEMSKNNRVLFVNPPLSRFTRIKERTLPQVKKRLNIIRKKEPEIEQINENLWVLTPPIIIESINWIRNPSLFDILNKINERKFAAEIQKAIDKLNFKNVIIFNDNSMIIGFYLKEFLKPSFSIYLLRDYVTLVSYHSRHGKRLEPLLIAKMNLMVANSDHFAEYGRKYNPHSYMIGQGCDLDRYNDKDSRLKIPEDLMTIKMNKKPVVGYVGFLTTIRLDIDVLIHIALSKPEWNLVLVGPEDEDFKNCKLHQLDNVYFLGRKEPEDLPAYIKGFDVAINPQIVNQITNVNYPLKIDEYLAMGKATVATKTDFMKYFKRYVHLPSNGGEYVKEISEALDENTPRHIRERIEFASTHSWEAFVNKIYNYINQLSKTKD